MAPSYIASIVAIIVGVQPILGLQFTSEEWSSAIIVVCGIVVAVRQIVSGRATWFGGRR